MGAEQYEVISLRVASDPERTVGKNFFFDSFPAPPETQMPQDYLFWVLRNQTRCLVVDTAFTPEAAAGRRRKMHRPVPAHLRDLGIDPTEVTDVVMTHLHWDHAGNIGLFPRARIHLQAKELAFCTGPAMLHPSVNKIYSVEDIQSVLVPLFEGRVNIIDGDADLFPGVRAIRVGGHTPGSMVLQVSTARGNVVLASDAAHFWANFERRAPFPILDSFSEALSAFSCIHDLSEGDLSRILPGHDPLQRQLFPSLDGLDEATRLHAEPRADIATAIAAEFRRWEAAWW
jgi:glyoxylase-like metal-dependent hydrolase (beta-lactamase superfamily II)